VDKETRWLPMPWKGLTEEEHNYYQALGFVGVKAVEEKLRAKNSTLACIPAVPPG
jgi:predicted nucleotidyltransferase